MPIIENVDYFGSAEERICLYMNPLWVEVVRIVTGFPLRVEERRAANGAAEIRSLLDKRFQQEGWFKKASSEIGWTKRLDDAKVAMKVHIQVSGRSALLVGNVDQVRKQLASPDRIDVGVIIVPGDDLAKYLPDRVANYSYAIQAVKRAHAEDISLAVVALKHDGPGPALPKRRTSQGRDERLLIGPRTMDSTRHHRRRSS